MAIDYDSVEAQRALQLARSECSDTEVVCVLLDGGVDPSLVRAVAIELGANPEDVEAAIALPPLRRATIAGRGTLRDYAERTALASKPTAGSLQMTGWVTRQRLGYSTGGSSAEYREAEQEIEGLSHKQLAAELRRQADELDPQKGYDA